MLTINPLIGIEAMSKELGPISMTVTVSEVLRTYKLRQGMARGGITKPNEVGQSLIDQLVERLSSIEPNLPCNLKHLPAPGGEWIAFIVEDQEVARVWMAQDSAQAG
jgi:hypothetical protein